MRALDAFLLAHVFSPIAWFIERRTGYNNFRQAIWMTRASAAGAVLYLGELSLEPHALPYFFAIMSPISCFWLFLCWSKQKQYEWWERLTQAYPEHAYLFDRNSWTYRPLSLALFIVMQSSLLANDIFRIHGLAWWLVWAYYYSVPLALGDYFAGVPRPPPRKKKESARDWFWFLRPVSVPT